MRTSGIGTPEDRMLKWLRWFTHREVLVLALLLSWASGLTKAQERTEPQSPTAKSATISGTVIDRSGAAVVGARVVLDSQEGSVIQQSVTGDNGQFSFGSLPAGDFQITIAAPGFATQVSTIKLQTGQFYIAPATTLAPARANTAVQVTADNYEVAEAQIKIQEQQRIIGFFPNYYVSYISDPAPLGKKQKFELAWRTMIDPATIIVTGATAGVEQAQNGYSDYGQGAQGYAKRFGASYADNLTDTMIGGAILPSLLKQDPRYFYKGTGSTRSRLLTAMGQAVICKGDNKHWQPNYSGIMGSLASGGISNLYYPEKDRGLGLTLTNAMVGIGSEAITNVLQEFVIRKFTPHAAKNNPTKP